MSDGASSPERFEPSFDESNQSHAEPEWSNLTEILREVGPNLSPDEELGDLAAAEAAVNKKDTERAEVVDRLRDELRLLTKQRDAAAAAATRPANQPSELEHEAQVRRLEAEQYAAGKSLNEEQVAIGKKESELGRWRAERDEVSVMQVEGDWADAGIIRLKMFAEAGFTPLPSRDGSTRILARNDGKPDVHTVTVDKRQRVYYANMLWNMVSE
ncbi:hypothetical protein Q5752_005212 [Cryptotrichosporon argae]